MWIKVILISIFALYAPTDADAKKKKKRMKTIEFEEGLIEGVRQTGGAFAALTQKKRREDKDHLYDREINFDDERMEGIKESGSQ